VVAEAGHRAGARPDAPTRLGWFGRTARAVAFGTADFDTITVALAGFLLRGGIVLLVIPSVFLPSVVGAASVAGLNAFGIDGRPTFWLLEVIAAITVAIGFWLVAAFVIGSLTDAWLIEAVVDRDGHAADRPRPLPSLALVLDLASVRALCALPLVGAILWAAQQVYTAGYDELTAPTDLATPILVRIYEDAATGLIAIAAAWLVTEVVGAIAVRRVVLLDRGVWRALGEAIWQLVGHPVTSLATVAVSLAVGTAAAAFAFATTATAFDWVRIAARDETPITVRLGYGALTAAPDLRPMLFIAAAVTLGIAWAAALAVSGAASAWRSAAFTEETASAAGAAAGRGRQSARLGLSGPDPERSGD